MERLPCMHGGTYADDCICERVRQHRCYIVATCDRDLRRRLRKVRRAQPLLMSSLCSCPPPPPPPPKRCSCAADRSASKVSDWSFAASEERMVANIESQLDTHNHCACEGHGHAHVLF